MSTLLVRDLINRMSIPPPPSLPDHSILSGIFSTSHFNLGQSEQSSFEPFNKSVVDQIKQTKKNIKKIDDTFLMSEETRQLVVDTIAKLEYINKNQGDINTLWNEIKEIFLNEMKKLPDIPSTNNNKMKKTFRKAKPFWNNELGNLWFSACQAEKQYLNFVVISQGDHQIKKNLQSTFKKNQSHFDKKFRYYKRKFNDKNQNKLLELASENNPNIWEKIIRLNCPPVRPPLEIEVEDDTISTDIKEIEKGGT